MLKIQFHYTKILRTANIRLLCSVPQYVNNADKYVTLNTTNAKSERLVEKVKQCLKEDLFLYDNFINEVEHDELMKEVNSSLGRAQYKYPWDHAICGFREIEKGRKEWLSSNEVILKRIKTTAFVDKTKPINPLIYVLDLAKDGHISPHVDSIKYYLQKAKGMKKKQKNDEFSGKIIAGVNLMSSAVMRFVHNEDQNIVIDLLLPVMSLYVIKDAIRLDFTHEILAEEFSYWNNDLVPRNRRVSIIMRNVTKPSSEYS